MENTNMKQENIDLKVSTHNFHDWRFPWFSTSRSDHMSSPRLPRLQGHLSNPLGYHQFGDMTRHDRNVTDAHQSEYCPQKTQTHPVKITWSSNCKQFSSLQIFVHTRSRMRGLWKRILAQSCQRYPTAQDRISSSQTS